jgi:hypothetical protein
MSCWATCRISDWKTSPPCASSAKSNSQKALSRRSSHKNARIQNASAAGTTVPQSVRRPSTQTSAPAALRFCRDAKFCVSTLGRNRAPSRSCMQNMGLQKRKKPDPIRNLASEEGDEKPCNKSLLYSVSHPLTHPLIRLYLSLSSRVKL